MNANAQRLAANTSKTPVVSSTRKNILLAQSAGLINHRSNIANDYLNHYNEVLLLIENLPVLLPEMIDELLRWRPISYKDYFKKSPLPGAKEAIELYENYLEEGLRRLFEVCIAQINLLAIGSINVIADMRDEDGVIRSEDVEFFCQEASGEMRAAIEVAADLVNNGMQIPSETAQDMADRILASFAPPSSSQG